MYVVTPVVLIVIPSWQGKVGLFQYYSVDLGRIDISIICLAGYTLMLCGWLIIDRVKARPYIMRLSKRGVERFAILGLVIGLISYFMYAISMGGVINSILYGSAIRYGRINSEFVGVGKGEVFKHFIFSLNLVFLFYLSKVFQRDSIKLLGKIIFIISGLFLLLYYLSIASRGAFLGLFLAIIVLLSYQDMLKKTMVQMFKKYLKMTLYLPIAIIIILFGKQFYWAFPALISGGLGEFCSEFLYLNQLRMGTESNFFRDSILKEASHGLVSLSVVIDKFSITEILWFRDFWLLPLHVIPSKILGLGIVLPPTVSAVNTKIIQGTQVASAPPGILAMLIYNVGFFGILFMFAYGVIGKWAQNKFIQTENSPARNLLLFQFAYLYGGFIGNADIKVYVYSAFPLVLLIIALYARKIFLKPFFKRRRECDIF